MDERFPTRDFREEPQERGYQGGLTVYVDEHGIVHSSAESAADANRGYDHIRKPPAEHDYDE